jgi:hypothetical protein
VLFPRVLADYVLTLEAEMQNLKHKLKALEEQLQSTEEPVKTSVATADPHHGVHSSAAAAGESPWLPEPYSLSQSH